MRVIFGAAMAMMMAVGSAEAGDTPLTVVELFTSQGCSSCPPADKLLAEMSRNPDLLPLAYHVDYWDYIGWKDTFAQPQFTARQEGYRRAAGARYKYTPQMVVGGITHAVGNRPMEVFEALDAHRDDVAKVMLRTAQGNGGVVVTAKNVTHNLPASEMVALMITFQPEETVEITRGENAGHSIRYSNIVTGVTALTQWDGQGTLELTLPLLEDTKGTGVAVMLQSLTAKGYPGEIQAALRLR